MSNKNLAYYRQRYKATNKRYLAYRREVRQTAACLYQMMGVLLDDTDRFNEDKGQMALDLLVWMAGNSKKRPHHPDDLLPYDGTAPAALFKAWLRALRLRFFGLMRMRITNALRGFR